MIYSSLQLFPEMHSGMHLPVEARDYPLHVKSRTRDYYKHQLTFTGLVLLFSRYRYRERLADFASLNFFHNGLGPLLREASLWGLLKSPGRPTQAPCPMKIKCLVSSIVAMTLLLTYNAARAIGKETRYRHGLGSLLLLLFTSSRLLILASYAYLG